MRFCSLLTIVFFAATCARGQDVASHQAIGIDGTLAPDSSHILIGSAENRRTWTVGVDYSHFLWESNSFRFDYEASISPFFQERDPELVGASSPGTTGITPLPPSRVVTVNDNPIGIALGGPVPILQYPVYGTTKTYAFAFSPIGARVSTRAFHRIIPSFSVDLGAVASSRDLPVDQSANFNYLFSFGPGLGFYYSHQNGVRLDYIYRHMSNANSGISNPGVDQGVFRLTFLHQIH